MRTDVPILVSPEEASFQLSVPVEEIRPLIEADEIVAVKVRGHLLILFESLTAFARREARRNRSKKAATA
jgi:hypothetical protein